MHKRAKRRIAGGNRVRARAAKAQLPLPAAKHAATPGSAKKGRPRAVPAEARRQAILGAALSVFAERGFDAARLDEVATRAGVAKGTLYLYFKDKQTLFEELVRSAVSPIMDRVSAAALTPGMPAGAVIDTFFSLFRTEVLGTERKLLLRLIISEGPRFPAIAQFYYREVVSRGVGLMRALAKSAHERREFASDAPARFPQLIVAPLLLSVIWDGLFADIDPLDVPGLLEAHRELLTGGKARKVAS
jgi:AcrR family transcriptional regulator